MTKYLLLLLPLSFWVMASPQINSEHEKWLKERFSIQHQELIPIVAVADMFAACNKARKTDPIQYQVADLITKIDKVELSEKLIRCLGDDFLQSEQAINFGVEGCFEEQFSFLAEQQKQEKMAEVKNLLDALPYAERQKSFTECVTMQAIEYLQ